MGFNISKVIGNNHKEIDENLSSDALTGQYQSDVLGIDNIVVKGSLWKLVGYAMVYGLFISMLITIGLQYLFKTPSSQIVQTFGTVVFFVGGIYLFIGAAVDMGEYSPFIRQLSNKKDQDRDDYNIRKGKSFYITAAVFILFSFVIAALEAKKFLP